MQPKWDQLATDPQESDNIENRSIKIKVNRSIKIRVNKANVINVGTITNDIKTVSQHMENNTLRAINGTTSHLYVNHLTTTHSPNRSQDTMARGTKNKIQKTKEEVSPDDEYFEKAVRFNLKIVSDTVNHDKTITVHVRLDDVNVRVEPDSGADVNLMDEHQFQALVNRSNNKPTLKSSKAKLCTLQHQLKVKGEFQTIIRNQTCGKSARFVVVYAASTEGGDECGEQL